ncbi:MAG TPA: hypothetical protein VI300_13425 [Solirubrobacter sp.]
MATSEPDRARRFARRRSDVEGPDDSLSELHSELVLLREENARLKAAEHKGPDIEGLLHRARSLSAARDDDAGMADETTKVLVEGLVIRESLLEICRQIERVMVSFEARLRALPGGQDREQDVALQPPPEPEHGGHWSEPPRLNGSRHDGAARA